MEWGILIAFIIQISTTVSVSIKATSNGTRASPGSTVRFTCLVSGLDIEQGLMTQVYKTRLIVETPTGTLNITPIGMDRWQVANNSVINYALADITDRYRVMEDDERLGTIHVDIKDARPEDSGFYGCRLIEKASNYIYLISQEHRIHVIGNTEDHKLFLRSQDNNKREAVPLGEDLILVENIKKNIECEFTVSNVLPSMDMYLGSSTEPYALNVSDDFYYIRSFDKETSAVGLPTQAYTFHFKNRHRYPKVKYHRKRFTCHTKMKNWKTFDAYVNILVKATPRNTSCEPPSVVTTPGSEVSITCKTWSYPVATSVWKLPNGTAIYSERMKMFETINQYKGDWLTSILSFTVGNDSSFGKYSLTVQNEIGIEVTHISITEEIISSAQDAITNSSMLWICFIIFYFETVIFS